MPIRVTAENTQTSPESPLQAARAGRKMWTYHGNPTFYSQAGGTNMNIPYIDIPVSVKAIAIGPDSDLGAVMVLWRPPSSTQEYRFKVDAHSPLIFDMPVNAKQSYVSNALGGITPATGISGSLKVFPYWLTNSDWDELDVPAPDDGVYHGVRVAPRLHLLVYFNLDGVQIPTRRPDKKGRRFDSALNTTEQLIWETMAYRRRGIAWDFFNRDAVKTVTNWRFVGVNFFNMADALNEALPGPDTDIVAQEHVISPTNTIAGSGSASYVLQGARFHAYRLYATASANLLYYHTNYTVFD